MRGWQRYGVEGGRTRAAGVACVLLLAACAASPMVRAAHDGDRASLAREVAAAGAHGRFALEDAASVAHAVVEHEIRTAPTPKEAIARINDVRACAGAVDDVLAARMSVEDSPGGEAAFVRAEAGALSDGSLRSHERATIDSWRAAAMWGMTRSGDREARARGLADGSPLVRRAALRAITERDDGTEVGQVYAAARLDPEPLIRSAAIRALGRLHGTPPDLAVRLRDLWTSADDGLREDLAGAFASPRVLKQGGLDALAHLLGTSEGNHAVTVAGVILGARIDDVAIRAAASAVLVSAIKDGGRRARIHAIAIAPLSGAASAEPRRGAETKAFLEAVHGATQADDPDVRLAALARLARIGVTGHAANQTVPPSDEGFVIQTLEGLGAPLEPQSLRGSRARLILAEAGDIRVQRWVEDDLASKDPLVRLNAAEALAALGRAARAAPLLADEDPSVRTRAACTILLASQLSSRSGSSSR